METRMSTIYKITNKVNNKVYIGFDSNWPSRMKSHLRNYKKNTHKTKILYEAFRKYGLENFQFDIVYQSWDKVHCLNIMEPFFIKEYRSFVGFDDCAGYNATLGGQGSLGSARPKNTDWRCQHSAIMSQNNPAKGRQYSEEQKKNLSEKIKKHFEENPSAKLFGDRNPMHGKTHSIESKQRIAESSRQRFDSIRSKILGPVACSFCSLSFTSGNLKRHERVCECNPDRVNKRTGREPILCIVCNCKVSPYKHKKYHQHEGAVNALT